MKRHKHKDSPTDDDMLIPPSMVHDMTIASRQSYHSADDRSSTAIVQSILDRIYRRESELPFLFMQWID